jgi:hypothetical protein
MIWNAPSKNTMAQADVMQQVGQLRFDGESFAARNGNGTVAMLITLWLFNLT